MKLLLADDHTLFRDALVQYIERAEPSAEVTVTKDFDEAFEHMQQNTNQDLILLDLRMPGMNGMEGFRKMRQHFPDTPVALMSGVAEPEDVQAAIELGAIGYFPKTLSGKALLQAIQSVLAGEMFIPTESNSNQPLPSYHGELPNKSNVTNIGLSEVQTPLSPTKDFNLTPRENDVLGYLVTGASNKEIASALGLQVVTVKLHVRGICRKLDAKNRTQAALIAREHGLIQNNATG
ncbi:MAG: response regulator transcription factor [Pseudomonadota bacterium]